MSALVIEIQFEDDSDLDFMRVKLVAAVEETMADSEGRLDDGYEVSWEVTNG